MALPLCPVCQNNYNTVLIPRVINPCGHGICVQCLDKYVSRGGDTCPICRTDILGTSVNYDLRAMCQPPDDGWKRDLQRILGRHMPGQNVELHDGLKLLSPMIRLRCEWTVGSLKEAKAALVKLVLAMDVKDVLQWITSLHFDTETEVQLLQHVSTLLEQKTFLQNDSWILELVHAV